MNREFKFRAWDTVRNEYLSAGNIFIGINAGSRPRVSDTYLDIIDHANMFADRFIIEQYTGMKDKNGKEIFEGDVIKFWNNETDWVEYNNGSFRLHDDRMSLNDALSLTRVVVVGTVHKK